LFHIAKYCIVLFITFCLFAAYSDAIAEPLRCHGLSSDQVFVFLQCSNTPLPLSSDCYLLAGSLLYVRGTANVYVLNYQYFGVVFPVLRSLCGSKTRKNICKNIAHMFV